MKFLARCVNSASPRWAYSTYRGDVQLEADSAEDARQRLSVIYLDPVKLAADKDHGTLPWEDPKLVAVGEVEEFDPAIPVAVVTAP